jgi:hypothetical protein
MYHLPRFSNSILTGSQAASWRTADALQECRRGEHTQCSSDVQYDAAFTHLHFSDNPTAERRDRAQRTSRASGRLITMWPCRQCGISGGSACSAESAAREEQEGQRSAASSTRTKRLKMRGLTWLWSNLQRRLRFPTLTQITRPHEAQSARRPSADMGDIHACAERRWYGSGMAAVCPHLNVRECSVQI